MAGQRETAMTVDPAISVRFAPGGLFIQAAESIRDDALVFLFLMPDGSFGPIHHFISTDDAIIAPVQETFEK